MNNKAILSFIILFIISLVIIVVLSSLNISKRNELKSFKNSVQTQQSIDNIEKNKNIIKDKEIENRELSKKIDSLNKQLNNINNKLDDLNLEELKYEIQKSDISSVSNRLTQLGYSSSVVSY